MKITDTYTHKKREFVPVKKGEVRMYVCGPTVYWSPHLGHAANYIRWDIIRQYLKQWKGYKVKFVMNITDFGHLTSDADEGEDKLLKGAKREHKTPEEIAEFYTNEFHESMDKLKVEKPDIEAVATKHVKEMIETIKQIIKNGYGYELNGTVYFDVQKLGNKYGQLSKRKIEDMKDGTSVEIDRNKKDPADFVLWAKHSETHAHDWDSPWGKGMPGWHTECITMGPKYLGKVFDIHTGGFDHFFPHHENEIAQAIALIGKPQANYWVHGAMINAKGGAKISKSLGNFTTILTVLKDHSPESIRMWTLNSHYRSGLEFDDKNLEQAQQNVDKINRFIEDLIEIRESGSNEEKESFSVVIKEYIKAFEDAMDDDFNTPQALAVVFEFMSDIYKKIKENRITAEDAGHAIAFLEKVDSVFKVMNFEPKPVELTAEQVKLIETRDRLREEKKWKEADKIRDQIAKQGLELIDTSDGTRWRKKAL